MSEDESEFIVVDESSMHETLETIKRLKEVMEMYKSSFDALTKSNILLQEQLHLALQLVLQRVPRDLEINKEDITNIVSRSVNNCSDSVRDEYVTNVCSKLVAVNANYEKVVKEFEEFKLNSPTLSSLEVDLGKISGILENVDQVLPRSEISISVSVYDEIPRPSQNSIGDKINALFNLAETIQSKVSSMTTSIDLKSTSSFLISDGSYLPVSDLSTTEVKESADKECETNFYPFNLERMLGILKNLNETLPSAEVSESNCIYDNIFSQPMNSTEDKMNALCDFAESINSRFLTIRDSILLQSTQSSLETNASSSITEIKAESDKHWEFNSDPNFVILQEPIILSPENLNNPSEPSYNVDEERPECPVCNAIFSDRSALEDHLAMCLSI